MKPKPEWGDDKPLTVSDAAAFADMPVSSLNNLIYSRQIARIRMSKRR
jgi:hypothetical protein